ncbi:MAG: hypothetical protein ACPG5P_08315 [Saprospiraceae bacterium]
MLEKYIEKNREQFDDELPGLDMWGKIDDQLNAKPKQVSHKAIVGRVAASIAILVISIMGLMFSMNEQPEHLNVAPEGLVAERHPEFNEMREYYSRNINKQMDRLEALDHDDIGLLKDIDNLESSYDSLLIDWEINPHISDEKIINAMIVNLRMRNELLNTVIHRIEKKGKWGEFGGSESRSAVFYDEK